MTLEKTCRDIVEASGSNVPEIMPQPILSAMNAGEPMPTIIDIRPEGERLEEGLIPGALHIPTDQLAAASFEIAETDADYDKPVILQCRSGKRSLTAAQILKQSGFRCALSLKGGIQDWEAQGGPVERPRG